MLAEISKRIKGWFFYPVGQELGLSGGGLVRGCCKFRLAARSDIGSCAQPWIWLCVGSRWALVGRLVAGCWPSRFPLPPTRPAAARSSAWQAAWHILSNCIAIAATRGELMTDVFNRPDSWADGKHCPSFIQRSPGALSGRYSRGINYICRQ